MNVSLSLAIKHAKLNPIKPRGRTSISRFACVLTNGYNTYIGWNTYKTHTLQAHFAAKTGCPEKIHIHAELHAIVQAARRSLIPNWAVPNPDLSGYKLYVARVLSNGEPANARPCESCWAAIAEFGIREVYWTE